MTTGLLSSGCLPSEVPRGLTLSGGDEADDLTPVKNFTTVNYGRRNKLQQPMGESRSFEVSLGI